MPVEVGRAIVPPDRAAFAQGHLGAIDRFMRGCLCCMISFAPGCADSTARFHQFLDQTFALIRLQRWIARAPEPPAHHEVASVRCGWIRSVAQAMRPLSDKLRKVIDQRGTSMGAMLCSQAWRTSPER